MIRVGTAMVGLWVARALQAADRVADRIGPAGVDAAETMDVR